MKFVTKVELRTEKNDKCACVCAQECEWGEVFDFAASLKSFAAQKIQELEQAKAQETPETKE